MKKTIPTEKMITTVILVMLGLIIVSIFNYQGKKVDKESSQENGIGNVISLDYVEIPIEPLNPIGVEMENWVVVQSIPLEGVGPEGTMLQLLIPTDVQEAANQVRGILVTEKTKYDLGDVGRYGLEDIAVVTWDVTENGKPELVLTGGMGAAYIERRIISYLEKEEAWVTLLTMGSPWDGDINGDGKQDVVAVSAGSIPSYVWLYRWTGQSFEKADLAAATGNYYAYILDQDPTNVIIESGMPHQQPQNYQLDFNLNITLIRE